MQLSLITNEISMKKTVCVFILLIVTNVFAQCANPFGWVKVGEKSMSLSERICIYERDGVRVQIVVNGFCPFSPC